MSKDEKSFQTYFMTLAEPLNYYRTSLTSGSGYPDVTGFHGDKHSLVELKDIVLGKKGDRLLKQFFEITQPPWYLDYLQKGGTRLFVAWRIRDTREKKWYGLLHLNKDLVMRLARNELRYSHLKKYCLGYYQEYSTCIDMVKDIEHWRGYDEVS